MFTTEGKREQEEEICIRDRINGPSRSSLLYPVNQQELHSHRERQTHSSQLIW